jgi:hypothetical protein
LRHLLEDIDYWQLQATPIMEDNQGCIKIAKNDMVQARTKHINSRHHLSGQAVKSGEVELVYRPTEPMLTDALTRALREVKFENLRNQFLFQTHNSIRAGVFKIKPVLLDSCSRNRIQAEGKRKTFDQSSQARADSDALKECNDSFPQIKTNRYYIHFYLRSLGIGCKESKR